MATHHGQPGTYARSAARRRLFRGFAPILLLLWVSGAIFGFLLARWDVPVVAVLCLITVGVLYGAMRFVDSNVDAMRREWLTYARGLDGERLVSSILDDLESYWHVFHGLQFWDDQDFDHVLVGPGGIFYIQTKNWRGLMAGHGDHVLRNGQHVDGIGRIRAQAMELKTRLAHETGGPIRWVNAILAVPFAWTDVKGEPKNVAVLQQQELLNYIQRQPKSMDGAQVERCVAALERLASMPPAPRQSRAAHAA